MVRSVPLSNILCIAEAKITKQCERMYALMAICTTLSPGPSDESVMSTVKEHYADQLAALQRGGEEAITTFKELYLQACPKYLSVNPPPYEDAEALEAYQTNPPIDATQRHLDLFLSDAQAVSGVGSVRNLLKLYTSIDAGKLAAFMQSAEGGEGEEEVLQELMLLKSASRTYAKQGEGALLDGERIVTNNLDFTIEGVSLERATRSRSPADEQSMVHIEETTTHRRFAGHFVRNAEHAQRVFNTIRAAPLPSASPKRPPPQTNGPRTGAPAAGAAGGKSGAWQPKRQVRIAA